MSASKKILVVTGATGFVGRHFVERILAENRFKVRCLVRHGSGLDALGALGDQVSFVHGDITRPETLAPAFEKAWAVVNLAGYRDFWCQTREHFYTVNEQGATHVFRACLDAGVKKVVQVSTPLAYGAPSQIPFNEDTPPGEHPSDYARSKYLGDKAGWELCRSEGLPLTTVYLAAVVGAGDDKSTMEVRRAVERRLPALVGADTTYTYLHVRDAADAIARALLKKGSTGRRYLIGNQRATTRQYFDMIGEIAGVSVPASNIPESWLLPLATAMEWLSRITGSRPLLPLDVIRTTAAGSLLFDGSRAIEELGMHYRPLRAALTESVEEILSEA